VPTVLFDLSLLLLTLLVFAIACLGWGVLGGRLLLPREQLRSLDAAWIGFGLILGLTELTHLFLPVNWALSLFFAGVGAGALGLSAASGLRGGLWKGLGALKHPAIATLVAVLLLSWCLHGLLPASDYDSGLYRLNTIRWINEYPVIPGLGNLHDRLAMNQSYFGFLALLNFSPFGNEGASAGSLFLLLLTTLTLLQSEIGRWRGGSAALLILALSITQTLKSIAFPSPDIAVVLLQATIFLYLLRILLRRPGELVTPAVVVLGLLAYTVVATKLSAVAFASLSLLLVAYSLRRELELWQRPLIGTALLLSTFSCVHFLRGWLLSGAPLFPSELAGDWGRDWAMPRESVRAIANAVYGWARTPGAGYDAAAAGWGWIGPWVQSLPLREKVYFAASFLLTATSLWLGRRGQLKTALFFLYIPLYGALVFWFLTAPDMRFLGGVHRLLLALSLWLVIFLWQTERGPKPEGGSLLKIFCFLLLGTLLAANFRQAGRVLTGIREPIPVAQTVLRTTDSGLKVLMPETGDQCWDAPLPCTPYFNPKLRSRSGDPNDISRGFSVKPRK
jgi:hypothetical protein